MDSRWIAAAALLPLAACAAAGGSAESTPVPAPMACHADAVQTFVGQTATADVGARLLRESGARTLRWAPPRSAMTMDYRPDRLTVSYDDAYKIDRVGCG